MRIDTLGAVAVHNGETSLEGRALGGRRARVVLVALALADGVVPAERLAGLVWSEGLPATWPAALRGIVRGLRAVCDALGGGDQRLIATVPAGYRLGDGVMVDVTHARDDLTRAAALLREGRFAAVVELAKPIAGMSGDQLLSGEDAEWLDPYRRGIDASALEAVRLAAEAWSRLGQHHRAIESVRAALDAHPFDEGLHRALITALDSSGDRAGAVRAYETCRSVLGEQLGVNPSPETVDAYLAALRDRATPAVAPVPVTTTRFIGRGREAAMLASALEQPGLVTLTGTGGVGKSRLAARVVSSVAEFDGGRFWAPLASVADDELVAPGVALLLSVAPSADDAAAAIGDRLAPLGRVVLVLDGCESVLDGAASLVAALLSCAPLLSVLATSRVPLAIDGETVLEVPPLPAPEADHLADNGQVQLLVARVQEAGGQLATDDDTRPHLMSLCRRCRGVPLSLELVAAQLVAMSPGDLLDVLTALDSAPADALRSIAHSSYLQLDADEAAVFRRFAVLDGPVGLSLVRDVVSDDSVTPLRVVRILRELTARGLLTVDRAGAHWRYQQDDDLHRFAGELLAEHGETAATYVRLASAIRGLLPEDARAAPGPFRAEITTALGSVRSLFAAGLSGRADLDKCQELAFRLHRYFATTNVSEGRFWLDRLIMAHPSGEWTAYATYALGYLSYWAGDTEHAVDHLRTAMEGLDAARDSYRARALIFLAGLLDDLDRGVEAVDYVRLAIEAAAAHDIDLQCSAAMGMGSVLAERVDPAAAGYAHDAIDLCRRGGSVEQLSIAMPTAAMICWQVGDVDSARRYVAEALPLNDGLARIARVVLLSAAAGVCLADGDLSAAVEYGSTAFREGAELGVEREIPLIRAVLARALLARGDIGDAASHTVGALETALAMPVEFPLAIGLETAALVLQSEEAEVVGDLLAVAAVIRHRGDRPASATLAPAVDALRASIGGSGVHTIDPRDVARVACSRLLSTTSRLL